MLCLDNTCNSDLVRLLDHLIEIKLSSTRFIVNCRIIPFKNQNIKLHNDVLIPHIKQKHSKSIVWMFNWWTCVMSVSWIWRVSKWPSDVTITFFKETKWSSEEINNANGQRISSRRVHIEQLIRVAKTFKILLL